MSRTRSVGRSGFTLVEMMIALVITLMIVYAMVEAFRWVGETTTDGRAVIEMLSQMRHGRYQVENDLSRCTVPLEPWRNEGGKYQGYFELIEGPTVDNRVDYGPAIYAGPNPPPRPNPPLPIRYIDRGKTVHLPPPPQAPRYPLGYLDGAGNVPAGYEVNTFIDDPNYNAGAGNELAEYFGSMFSDVDDILMFTARNDDKPFRGRYGGNIIESNYAEIIWWAELNDEPEDADGDGTISLDTDGDGLVGPIEGANGTWDPGETFTIRRRVLLIRPDLNNLQGIVQPINANNANTNNASNNYDYLTDAIRNFQAFNDLSVRVHFSSSNPVTSNTSTEDAVGLAANSLGDLTYRHNRSAHAPLDNTLLDGSGVMLGLSQGGFMSPVDTRFLPAYILPDMYGEDVVLTNVLAFDFRVWDPNVPIAGYAPVAGETREGLLPGDPGYTNALVNNGAIGRGGFVDLGCLTQPVDGQAFVIATAANSRFIGNMLPRSFLRAGVLPVHGNFVYDPWSVVYEKDGRNQDAAIDSVYAVDERTDGIDGNNLGGPDDLVPRGQNGVDDDGDMQIDEADEEALCETETFPPYLHPLDSLQVRIRMYEPDTRQVRQVSQTVRFGIE